MAFTGIKFCKPTVVDTKKQNSGPIFQPLRLLSSATGSTMHPPKNLDFPFVPLTGEKLVDDHCIPTNFDIMNNDTNFDGDLNFDNSTNARSIFKNASLKGCHQFPVISISQLVGGFVGSKSQVHAKNRESHQIWDIVFKKLDEFVSSRPVERYSEHCYEFQTLSQNFIGSLYKESNSALGLAASYILADGGQSFKNAKPNGNIAKSSPKPVEIISPPVDTSVSSNPTLPSHSPSDHHSSVPVTGIFNFVEHLISPTDLSNHDVILPDPLELTRRYCSVSTSSNLEPSIDSDKLANQPLNKDSLQDNPSLVSSDVKQSYAEVAKMAHAKSKMETDCRQSRLKNSLKRNKVNHHYFAHNFADSRQRCADSSNWRDQASMSGQKDLRRDHFTPAHSVDKISGEHRWRSKKNGEPDAITTPQGHRQRKREGLKYFKPCRPSALKTVHEVASRSLKEAANPSESPVPTSSSSPTSCQFYNPNKRSCMNWRCRQNCQKSSAKRSMRYILMDNIVRDCSDDPTVTSDASPSPKENRDIRVNNSFEMYITMPPSDQPLPISGNNSADLTRGRSDPKPGVQSLPCMASFDERSTDVRPKDDDAVNALTRPRSLSETSNCHVETESTTKGRSLSESSESVKSVLRSRSISEESKANSLSSSSLSSSNSCKAMSEGNMRRRFSSECDSEDSFVIFDGEMDCEDYDSTDIDSDESSESSEDEVDSTSCARLSMVFCLPMQDYEAFENAQTKKLQELNARWGIEQSSSGKKRSLPCKKVQFVEGPCLATIHQMVKWDYAYRAARCGPWEEMARDRERFKQRVERSEPILAAVLRPAHREKIRRRLDTSRDRI